MKPKLPPEIRTPDVQNPDALLFNDADKDLAAEVMRHLEVAMAHMGKLPGRLSRADFARLIRAAAASTFLTPHYIQRERGMPTSRFIAYAAATLAQRGINMTPTVEEVALGDHQVVYLFKKARGR